MTVKARRVYVCQRCGHAREAWDVFETGWPHRIRFWCLHHIPWWARLRMWWQDWRNR